jgi:hypothetical protein
MNFDKYALSMHHSKIHVKIVSNGVNLFEKEQQSFDAKKNIYNITKKMLKMSLLL